MNRKYFLLIFLSATIGFGLIGAYLTRPAIENKPKVAATIFPLYDMIRNVAGDKLEVILILKPGASPHNYDLTPGEVRELTGSRAVFAIGHGLDDWAVKLAERGEVRDIIILDKQIKPLYDSEGSFDPHYWLSLPNAELMAEQVKDELVQRFPENESVFQKNLINYRRELVLLGQQINQEIGKLPTKNLATFHQAWNYFARDHQLRVVATFEEYPGKEPTAEYLLNFENEMKKHQVKVLFLEPQFSTQPLLPIADDLGLTLAVLDPIGGVTGRETYLSLMQYNVNQIKEALK